MTTNKYVDKKYVILIGTLFFGCVLCSTIIDPNIVDIVYLALSFVLALRYIMVCIKN